MSDGLKKPSLTVSQSRCLSLQQLVDYKKNKLSPEERNSVQDHLDSCNLCSAAVEGLNQISNVDKFQSTINHLNHSFHERLYSGSNSLFNWRILAAAASLLLMIAGIYYLINRPSVEDELFAKYFQLYPNNIPIVRSQQTINPIQLALQQYELLNIPEAVQKFDQIIEKNPENLTAQFYAGVCKLSNQQPKEAASHFRKILDHTNSEFCEPALWYLALTMIKNCQLDSAKQILRQIIEFNGQYQSPGKNLLFEINSIKNKP